MKKFPVVLDLETKYTFREVSEHEKLGITVVGIYDYTDNKGKVFTEQELNKLYPILENASYIIGYNVKSFDLAVLQGYYPGDTSQFPVFDILDDIKSKIGYRIGLGDVLKATLGKGKTGHGLMAIDMYKEGRMDELKQYCLDDACLTQELFEYGIKFGQIFYLNETGKATIKVDWKKYKEDSGAGNDVPLTLPF